MCMMIVVYADAVIDVSVPVVDVVVVDVVMLFDPFLPDFVDDKDEVDVEADADVLREVVLHDVHLKLEDDDQGLLIDVVQDCRS